MNLTRPSLRGVARGAGVLAWLSGGYGFLFMLGAFGPVSCWTTQTATESAGGESTTVVTRGCEAGIDYLFGSTGGNAPVLFGWAMVLIGLVAFGGAAAWVGYRCDEHWVVLHVPNAVLANCRDCAHRQGPPREYWKTPNGDLRRVLH
jgi:hypothetical protein